MGLVMQKIIIGISSPNNKTSQAAIAKLAELYGLEHINMRQPLINMVAVATCMDPCAQEFYCSQQTLVEHLGVTIEQLEITLGFTLRTIKSDFFIQRCAETMAISNSGFNGQLFSGQIISGIKTELEAQWLRAQGGHMVHLYQYDNHTHHHPLHELDGDLVCILDKPTENPNLSALIASLDARLTNQLQAA